MDDIKLFLSKLDNEARQKDAHSLLSLLESASGYKPYLMGSIIGFGHYHYQYESGREGESAVIAFSPRKQHLVVYIMPGFEAYQQLLSKLGKHKLGKSCLYINKLSDINLTVFTEIATHSVKHMQQKYHCKAS
ncbi:DUF1801 domain-containing protein [Shewanella inventionis]|uniref:YdhG-like domain-containing protein n=1 Tax=Shewanella inventionis TaxID=1738770 RepID=A0ABQ1IS24_9GAMM|nr:DUF1801 domain-containing protein [Shewanella inventionis]MCL1156868.1 DUF1801 domain-containing protein [Shewanella inventionis]GGB51104.1 hypothetical protein GCM10011607_09400 [Shewanella inventionis]